MNFQRDQGRLDQCLVQLDRAVVTLFGRVPASRSVPLPDQSSDAPAFDVALTPAQARYSAQLMRVNHAGEICAQALYYGQACTTQSADIAALLFTAAKEEADHLAWCQARLVQLGSRPSYLGVFWYKGSFLFGMIAGLLGVEWGLGFVQETEKQVAAHLDQHLALLPQPDRHSRAILEKMREEEAAHAHNAHLHGAKPLPAWVCTGMRCAGKVMTFLAKWV